MTSSKLNLYRLWSVISLLLLIFVASPLAQAKDRLLASAGAIRRTAVDQSGQYQELRTMPTLSYLPTYTGKNAILQKAFYYPDLPNGHCYNLKYLAKEDPKLALEWFHEALLQQGWRIENDNIRCSVTAFREGGYCCYVYTRQASQPGYRAEIIVRFSINNV